MRDEGGEDKKEEGDAKKVGNRRSLLCLQDQLTLEVTHVSSFSCESLALMRMQRGLKEREREERGRETDDVGPSRVTEKDA